MTTREILLIGALLSSLLLGGCFQPLPDLDSAVTPETGAIRYVGARTLNVRTCPRVDCKVAVKLYRGDRVEVFEIQDGWSRISPYYSASVEGLAVGNGYESNAKIARWASGKYLWKHRPNVLSTSQDSPKPISIEEKIHGLPEVGINNFTEEDRALLVAYASKVIQSGECQEVEYADKSVIIEGRYYVHCSGEELHRFFFPGQDNSGQ